MRGVKCGEGHRKYYTKIVLGQKVSQVIASSAHPNAFPSYPTY